MTIINKELIAEAGRIYGDEEYFKKSLFNAVRFYDGIFIMHKSNIQTAFCFGEHGYDYEEVVEEEKNSRCYEYFLHENIKEIEWKLDAIAKNPDKVYLFQAYCSTKGLLNYTVDERGDVNDGRFDDLRKATSVEVEAIQEMLQMKLENMQKRCKTWWKRYGANGLHTWVYWADA